MDIDLSGKTAIISASTAGIGLATAKGLAASGAMVVVNGRTSEAVDRVVKLLGAVTKGAKVAGFAADLGDARGCDALVAEHPRCDILVNNLGIYGHQDFFEISDSEWTRFFDVNVMSGVRLSRAYLPGMIERGWGRVIFVSSESALNIPANMIHYGVTKTAQLSIARGLAKRAAGTGVTVNSVCRDRRFQRGWLRCSRIGGWTANPWRRPPRPSSRHTDRRRSSSGRRVSRKSPI
jgi:NAD(P)-dependent dehydrogenase (short-subunit alcohol dehydrogenase family)